LRVSGVNGTVPTSGEAYVVTDDARLVRGNRGTGISALATAPSAPTTDSGQSDDHLLVARVRRGDDRAFEALYHRYHRRITAYINGMVKDHAKSEDIAQDVFMSALRRMRDTDRPIAFKPWIYEIAKNACIDQFRRSRRAEEVSYDAEEGLGSADYGRLVSAAAVPEQRMESKQALDDLCGAFGGLSEAHHQILVMRELEGLSYREIGERLDMSRPSVESTLFRARRRLTEEYEELVSGARCLRIQTIITAAGDAALGARDQRRLARHVSHCQPCRRQARVAGLEVAITEGRPVRAKIAAFIPLPLFLRRWMTGGGDAAVGSHVGGVAQWSAQFGGAVDPGWLKAAATAATVAVAGLGAGVAAHDSRGTSNVGGGGFASLAKSFSDGGRHGVDDRAAVAVAQRAAARKAAPARTVTLATSAPTGSGSGSGASGAAAGGAGAVSGASASTPASGGGSSAVPAVPAVPAVSAPSTEQAAQTPKSVRDAVRPLLTPPASPAGAAGSTAATQQRQATVPDPAKVVQDVTQATSLPASAPDAGAKVGEAVQQTTDAATGAVQDAGAAVGDAAAGVGGALQGAAGSGSGG